MGQSKKPLKVIKAEISQMFSTLPPEEQRVAIERPEELMEKNKGWRQQNASDASCLQNSSPCKPDIDRRSAP